MVLSNTDTGRDGSWIWVAGDSTERPGTQEFEGRWRNSKNGAVRDKRSPDQFRLKGAVDGERRSNDSENKLLTPLTKESK